MRRPLLWALVAALSTLAAEAEPLELRLRTRREVASGSGRFHAITERATWDPRETAIVVCDMWDTHTCPASASRVAEMAPRMNAVLEAARDRGVFIIHAPSDTMAFYEKHPGRALARAAPPVVPVRPLERWCDRDPDREPPLPIDDAGLGCDVPTDWKPGDAYPWTRQIATLAIGPGDAITDSAEAYALLRQRGIKHLLVMGVHANRCVLGRPFAIRQMVRQGLDVVLVRDLTDTMYDPARAPFVSHFTGTDLVVEHIERFWCPTTISGEFLDGEEFRFAADTRPHVVILQGETEYRTAETLPPFAVDHLGKEYRVSFVWLDEATQASFPGIEVVRDADVLFISVRRRPLPAAELDLVRAHVAAGKPVLGIRTASHAFHLRDAAPPAGLTDWPDLDPQVFGGRYTNHHPGDVPTRVRIVPEAADHPILRGLSTEAFSAGGGLYLTAPLAPGATELLRGRAEGVAQEEPVAWTFVRADGGRSFYTSLGHRDDFERPEFASLITNALRWLTSP